jgi:hypothetical protein
VALTRGRTMLAGLLVAAVVIAAAGYLRDPPWLLSITSGLRTWESDRDGRRFRWMGGHASLFVPSGARVIEIPVHTTFESPADWPVTVNVAVDDRPGDRLVLSDGKWHTILLRLPPAGSRRVRRIDIRVDRTRGDNRGAAIGEVRTR